MTFWNDFLFLDQGIINMSSLTGRGWKGDTTVVAPTSEPVTSKNFLAQTGKVWHADLLGRPAHIDTRSGRVGPGCDGIVHTDATIVKLHPVGLLFGLKMI